MPDTDILAALIQKKHECLVQLCVMGRRQWEMIQESDMTKLLDVLVIKQRVLLELQRMERLMAHYRDQAPEEREWKSPELRQQCARQLEECKQLFQDVVRQEKQCEQEMIRRRDEAASLLAGFHQARQASDAYAALPPEGASRLDLSSGA
jgi:hypothetical protein